MIKVNLLIPNDTYTGGVVPWTGIYHFHYNNYSVLT
jgi:hypothetical protein